MRNGDVIDNGNKRTLWVDAKVRDNPLVMRDIKEKFLKYYSITQSNYESLGHHFVPTRWRLRWMRPSEVRNDGKGNNHYEKPARPLS